MSGRGNARSVESRLYPNHCAFLIVRFSPRSEPTFPTTEHVIKRRHHNELAGRAATRGIDVLILALPVDIDGMESRIVGSDPFRMIISRNQADSIKVPIRYADLPDESVFLLEREHCLTEHAVSACKLTDKEKINPFSATSLHTLVQMVANGLGTTFIPQMAIDHGLIENQNLVVVDPPGKQAHRHIGLVWRPSSSRVSTFNQLADVVSGLL